eukprot:scaffold310_cov212-Cylindrotheca_fusiformis.AAC.1
MGYSTEEGFHGYSTAIGIEWDIAQKRFGKRSAFASKKDKKTEKGKSPGCCVPGKNQQGRAGPLPSVSML